MIYRILTYLAITLGICYASIKWHLNFRYEDFRDYLTFLSAVSGMVFTIMGIWIAFLYPNAISRIINPDKLIAADFSEYGTDAKRLEKIVGAIISSSLVMVAALLIILFKILLSDSALYAQHKLEFKSIALSLVIFITFVQLEAIVHVVVSNVMFINDLYTKQQNRKSEDEL